MAPQPPILKPQNKFNFSYGHHKPSQNCPIVRGGLFSNRQSLSLNKTQTPKPQPGPFDLHNWDPHFLPQSSTTPHTFNNNNSSLLRLSPITRFIVDSFRKNQNRWGPPIVSELNKLCCVTPNLVAEVLKLQLDPTLASKFFHWASKQKGFHHNFAAYNALTYFLNRSNRFRSTNQLPKLMHSHGKPPTEKQFEILIRMHSDTNHPLSAFLRLSKDEEI
jgi:hypothetical protein